MYIDPVRRHFTAATASPVRATRCHCELDPHVASELRLLATALLEQSFALYLTISADTGQVRAAPEIRCHDGFWRTVEPHSVDRSLVLRRLREAALPIIEKLAASWPPNARPRRIGFMTDGSGAIFSPDLPCPDIEGWAAMLLDGSARSIDLVPFTPKSSWSLMAVVTKCTH